MVSDSLNNQRSRFNTNLTKGGGLDFKRWKVLMRFVYIISLGMSWCPRSVSGCLTGDFPEGWGGVATSSVR